MAEQTGTTDNCALPESVPWPTVVYTLGIEEGGTYRPSGTGRVDTFRSHLVKGLAQVAEPSVLIIQTTVMPWKPAPPSATGYSDFEFEYTVGFGQDGEYTTWGRGFSRDRRTIEEDLAVVQAATAEHNLNRAGFQWSLTPLLLERPVIPWRRG
jgi:hypothetical protein